MPSLRPRTPTRRCWFPNKETSPGSTHYRDLEPAAAPAAPFVPHGGIIPRLHYPWSPSPANARYPPLRPCNGPNYPKTSFSTVRTKTCVKTPMLCAPNVHSGPPCSPVKHCPDPRWSTCATLISVSRAEGARHHKKNLIRLFRDFFLHLKSCPLHER